MARPVKRIYDNEGRRARSEETRNRIVEAARELLTAKGYRATTLAEIARRAQVHVDTIYELVGRKPEILRELIERAVSGAAGPLEPQQRSYVQAMQAEPDPARKLALYATAIRTIHTRMAPLLVALRDAASTEPEATEVWRDVSERRARNMRLLVADLGPEGTLRADLTVDDAADIVWATASAELFLLFTGERGWTLDRYERWLAETWQRTLLA